MTLIKSISGIRGTIGGKVGDNLTPVDAVKFASAYGTFLKNNSNVTDRKLKVVIGRDARISGPMIHNLVMNTLVGLGIDNCLIQVTGPEMPIMDGSSLNFIEILEEAGIVEQDALRDYFEERLGDFGGECFLEALKSIQNVQVIRVFEAP